MAAHKTEGTLLYQALPADCHNFMEEVVPLPEIPPARMEDFPEFETWQRRKNSGPESN